jgi:hypothetical protein
MTFRDRWRRIRLYLKSWAYFRTSLTNPIAALRLPWTSSQRFLMKSGAEFSVRGDCWYVLPNFIRLSEIGAHPSVIGKEKCVRLGNATLYSPLETTSEGAYFREIYVDDVYRIRDSDLTGKVVVDIGAYIGDSAIAFALRGAEVYALEPSRTLFHYLEKILSQTSLLVESIHFQLASRISQKALKYLSMVANATVWSLWKESLSHWINYLPISSISR